MPAERYAAMFARLAERDELAFVPFFVLGDPSMEENLALISAAVEAGADGLELGLPFSDPIADGPAVQSAVTRALEAGTRISACWPLLRAVRNAHPTVPIGLLVYANLIVHAGVEAFVTQCAAAGVDSVVIPDAPSLEQAWFAEAFAKGGVALARILPPGADAARVQEVARSSAGYVYVTSRGGVTGADDTLQADSTAVISALQKEGAAPALLGFGIAQPTHVHAARAMGVAGAISGSAVVQRIGAHGTPAARRAAVVAFVREMKGATGPHPTANHPIAPRSANRA
ncbi:MAG: tryptophan synthase subunit alpha [Gemmatimonadetes bacterium]|nr:tryptophan synthase subunit alpha [Gemmatimonadota bacterium]